MEQRNNADVIVETVALEGKRVVDVGCGDGHLARHMAQHGALVTGIECNPRQLAKAHAAAPVAGERIVEGVGQALPLPDGSADLVVFFNSLHHIPPDEMGKALAEAVRVLQPGGQVYVAEPLAEGPFFEAVQPISDETEVRARALAALTAARGLVAQTEIFYVNTVRMASFEAFRDRILSINPDRDALFARIEDEMRARFTRLAEPAADGFRFAQPMRVNLLRRP